MGRSRYVISNPQSPHFLTNTILNWIPIFTRPATVNIVLDSLKHLQQHHQLKLYGYVILENHMHWLAQSENLPKDIHRFKSYTAKMILRYLQAQQQEHILKQLAFYKKRHISNANYQLWEEGSHPVEIVNETIMRQRLDYIHQNPVKRGYVDNPAAWRYSSARNYEGMDGLIEVVKEW